MPGARTEGESQGQEEGAEPPAIQGRRGGEMHESEKRGRTGGGVEGGGGCWLSRVELIDFGMASCVLGVCGTECRFLYIYA